MSNEMGRLVEDNPTIKKRRSYIPYMKHKSQLDFNAGLLVPMDKPLEVLPGDTFKLSHKLRIRMSNPPKVPVFDLLVFDLYFFYTPCRILWDNFDKFITGDTGTDWTKISDLSIPICSIESSFAPGSLLDFLGLYHGDFTESSWAVNALPFRAYYSIWNHFFRYEPLQSEVYFGTGDTQVDVDSSSTIANNISSYYSGHLSDYMSAVRADAVGSMLLMPVNKLPDYFTRCLPSPAAGPDISLLGVNNLSMLGNLGYSSEDGYGFIGVKDYEETISGNAEPIQGFNMGGTIGNAAVLSGEAFALTDFKLAGITGNTIRDLRQAFAIDQLLTLDARYGRRINEYSIGHYGVNVPDYRIDFPEFLSHKRVYLNINQVIQSSASEVSSPQGNVGAWSETFDQDFDFVKSFVEHGYIMSVGCVRVLNRTYSQGIDKLWRRFTRFDFYDPALANISDQVVYKEQLFTDDPDTLGVPFGYQEAWAEYKYAGNHIANHMRPNVSNTLAVWNYAEYYSEAPTLSEEWIIEDASVIDRTMYLISSNTVSQFIIDIFFDYDCYRTMPLHTLPGSLTNSW